MQNLITDFLPGLAGAGTERKNRTSNYFESIRTGYKNRTHPFHVMQDNSLRVYFEMVNSGQLSEMEQAVIDALEQYPESTAYELSVASKIPIGTCAARISDVFNDKKHCFPVKLIEACADRKDLHTGRIATPWRLSRRPHYYTKTKLIKFRKWTPAAITQFLQYPDETETNPHSDSINAPPMQLFLANRVWSAEATQGYKEYQKERKQKRGSS